MHSLSHARLQVLGGDEKWIIKIHVNLHCVCWHRARYHFWVPRLSSIKRFDGPQQSLCGTTSEPMQCVNLFIIIEWCCWLLQLPAVPSTSNYNVAHLHNLLPPLFFFSNSHIHITQHIEHSISVESSENHLPDNSFKFRVNDAVKGLCTDARRAACSEYGEFLWKIFPFLAALYLSWVDQSKFQEFVAIIKIYMYLLWNWKQLFSLSIA